MSGMNRYMPQNDSNFFQWCISKKKFAAFLGKESEIFRRVNIERLDFQAIYILCIMLDADVKLRFNGDWASW